MKTVTKLIEEIIDIEGGYTNDPKDPGGPTKYGITLLTLRKWRKDFTLTAADVEALEIPEAVDIYLSVYYQAPGIDKLPELLRPVAFDMTVNMGEGGAIKLLQMVLNKMGAPITADGNIGPMTCVSARAACNVYGVGVLRQIADARISFYRGLVERKPDQKKYLKGWTRRAEMFVSERD